MFIWLSFMTPKNCGHINFENENNFVGGINMKKPLLFVSSAVLSMSLLVGCNTDNGNGNGNNLNPTGVDYNNNNRLNTENVRYNNNNGLYRGDDMLDPGNVRYDMNNGNNNRGFNNNRGDADLLDVDYDNAEPDPGAEPNERNRGFFNGGNNGNGLFNNNNRDLNGNGAGNGSGGGMGTGSTTTR